MTASKRILMRAGRPPQANISNEAALAWRGSGTFGSNTGNMLFSDSVYQLLNTPGTEVTCDNYAPEWRTLSDADVAEINNRYDAYVLPLANAFRKGFGSNHLKRLTKTIKRLTIPVIVVDVGGQTSTDGDLSSVPDDVLENTKDFVSAVLQRSASLGVRGELTKRMLLKLGFSDNEIDVIGCPSMYMNGRDFQIHKKVEQLDHSSPLAINLSINVENIKDFYQENEKAYSDLITIYQTLPAVEYVMWGKEASKFPDGIPKSISDRAYVDGRVRAYTHPRPWRDFMRTRDFAFGPRIHGNVAALSAGTPAFMLSIDSRTQELADYHGIPTAKYSQVMASGKYLASDLHDNVDFGSINRAMPQNFDRYIQFIEKNGLEHIYQPGNENPAFDSLMESVALAPEVRPLTSVIPQEMASRIHWLWQDRAADNHRPVGSYSPEFFLDETRVRSSVAIAKDARAEARLRKSESHAQESHLSVEIEELRAQVKDLQEYRSYLTRPFGLRLRDAVRRRLRKLNKRHTA